MRTKGDRYDGDSLVNAGTKDLEFGRAKEMHHKHRYKSWSTVNIGTCQKIHAYTAKCEAYLINLHRMGIHFFKLSTQTDS